MPTRSTALILLALIAALLPLPIHAAPHNPSNAIPFAEPVAQLTAFHRSGQTFLTWPEVPGDGVIRYRIYRQAAPFDSPTGQGVLIAEVPQGSATYWTERARLQIATTTNFYPGIENYVITHLGQQLADGTGLFVWTAHEGGEFYYSVVPVVEGAIGEAMTFGPVAEAVADPEPVLVWQSWDGNGRVYTQFMDYAAYNPTYDAPRADNDWLGIWGLSEQPLAPYYEQYAYNYFVGLPTRDTCPDGVPSPLPLVLQIEGWGARYETTGRSPWFCAVHILGDDPSQSWYYGFSATHDYRQPQTVASTGPIVNYTEQRLLRSIYDVIRDPNLPTIDPQRIYAYGHSMGGTGALMLGERYPNVFAAVHASQPLTNFRASLRWVNELEMKWGYRGVNLPVENRGRYAGHLVRYNGTGVWDWQHLGQQLEARRGDDMAFIWLTHGTQDIVIDWATVGQPTYAHFYQGHRAFAARIDAIDHTWTGFIEMPFGDFGSMQIVRDETIPALIAATGSLPVPPTGPGEYNTTIEWSSSWNTFADPPVDEPNAWAMAFRSTEGTQRVMITPRRVQAFVITPGAAYLWRNVTLDGREIASGRIIADGDGLLTVSDFEVSEIGNWLVIEPESPTP